jgi:hypothetical protein
VGTAAATLEGWITCASTPCASSQRASQKPPRPASKASAIRVIVRPALTASSRQRCSRGKQRFWARLQLLARLTLNPGKHAANQPARLAQLDDGNDRAILVEGDEGPAQSLPRRRPGSFGWGIAALHRLMQRRSCHFLAARPIASFGPSLQRGVRLSPASSPRSSINLEIPAGSLTPPTIASDYPPRVNPEPGHPAVVDAFR